MSTMSDGKWISMGEAATLAGVTLRRFRPRMLMLNAKYGGELLRQTGNGKKKKRFEVHTNALLLYQRADVEWRDAELAQLRADLEETKRKLDALRTMTLAFRKKALAWF